MQFWLEAAENAETHFNPIALRKAKIAVLEIKFFFAGTCSNYLLPSIKVDSKTNIPGSKIGCLLTSTLVFVRAPVVQSIVSLMNLLRGQFVKCFMTLLPNTLIFFVEKMREAFAVQKLLTFFQQKILTYLRC